jgi:hypothetical protein
VYSCFGKIVNDVMQRLKKIGFLYIYIFLLNILDAVATHYSVSRRLAWEVNPLMDYLLHAGAGYFYTCKIVLVVLGLTLLKRLGDTAGTRLALRLCALIYTVIICLHMQILF